MELEKYLIAEEGIISNFLKKRAEKKRKEHERNERENERESDDKLYKKYIETVVIPKIPPKAIDFEKKYMLKDLNLLLTRVKSINNDFNRKFGEYVGDYDAPRDINPDVIYVFDDYIPDLIKGISKIGNNLSYEDYTLLTESTDIIALKIDMRDWTLPYEAIFGEIIDFCDNWEDKLKALQFKYITKIFGGYQEDGDYYNYEIETQNSSEKFKKIIDDIMSERSFETWKSNPNLK